MVFHLGTLKTAIKVVQVATAPARTLISALRPDPAEEPPAAPVFRAPGSPPMRIDPVRPDPAEEPPVFRAPESPPMRIDPVRPGPALPPPRYQEPIGPDLPPPRYQEPIGPDLPPDLMIPTAQPPGAEPDQPAPGGHLPVLAGLGVLVGLALLGGRK